MIRLLAAAALLAMPQDEDFFGRFKGKTPPELLGEKDAWINSASGLKLADLKGKAVVWVEFSFIKCTGCKRMKPTLIKWHREWGPKGLMVIDVDDGNQDTLPELKDFVAAGQYPFPVLWDKEGKTVAAYGVQAMPVGYLVGVDGTVLWEGVPNLKIPEIEGLIEKELAKLKK
jgi:thiol-disulfide isomerase/thioredoxin